MASMRQIRSRIRVAKNIQQITKAMKMVAAARLRRAQEAVNAARPYSERMREVVQRLAANVGSGSIQNPLLRTTESAHGKIGVLLITGDRGLCGSYNSNGIRKANEIVRPLDVGQVRFFTVGKRGANFFRRRGYEIAGEHSIPNTGVSFAEAKAIAVEARQQFERGEIDKLYLVYTRFISAMTQRPTSLQLLPLEPPETDQATRSAPVDVIFEPSPEEILEELLSRYVDTLVYQAIIESTASEHGARMTSMSSATDNAGKMISGLTLSLNRARQSAITKELAEIIGGADALKS
jgi:F-type H+-transporting ATPase subunit gamma